MPPKQPKAAAAGEAGGSEGHHVMTRGRSTEPFEAFTGRSHSLMEEIRKKRGRPEGSKNKKATYNELLNGLSEKHLSAILLEITKQPLLQILKKDKLIEEIKKSIHHSHYLIKTTQKLQEHNLQMYHTHHQQQNKLDLKKKI